MTVDTLSEKLDTCPFCGGVAEIVAPEHEVVGGRGWFVSCVNRAEPPIHESEKHECVAYAFGSTRDEVVAAWNRRSDTELQSSRATIDGLRGERDEARKLAEAPTCPACGLPVEHDSKYAVISYGATIPIHTGCINRQQWKRGRPEGMMVTRKQP